MNQFKRIFIIGHPGAGKALFAKSLAEKLGWQFVDADFGLEFQIGRTISEIVGKQGVNAMQDCESEILATLLNKENIVVTTDASIVSHEKNRHLLSSEFVVYLKVSTAVQIERTSRKPLPLLAITDLKTFFDQLHLDRDHLYEQVASITINSDIHTFESHLARIITIVLESKHTTPVSNQISLDKKDIIFFHKTLHTPVHLSDQQATCLKLLAQGKTSKEIARDMNLSFRTVEDHIAKTMELLGCSSSKELIALYYDQP